jgi:hypothetical protein
VPQEPSSTARLLDSGGWHELWQGTTALLSLRWNNRGALEICIRGHCSADVVPHIVERADSVLRQAGRMQLFYDLADMPSYDSSLRVLCVEWMRVNLGAIVSIDVLGRSKLVAMGVAVANIVLRDRITLYKEREGKYTEAIRRAGFAEAVSLSSGV